MPRKKQTEPDAAPPEEQAGRYRIERYRDKAGRKTRFFALSEGDDLLAVTVYRKGAEAIRRRLERYEEVIAEKTQIIDELSHAQEPQTPEAPPRREQQPTFRERVGPHRTPEQLSLIAADKRGTYRRTNPKPDPGPKRGR